MPNTWYAYVSGDPTLPASYRRITGKPGCTTGSTICAIYTPNGGLTPQSPFSSRIQDYIADALANLVPEPQFPANAKKYVYLKNL